MIKRIRNSITLKSMIFSILLATVPLAAAGLGIIHIYQNFAVGDQLGCFEYIPEALWGALPPNIVSLVLEGAIKGRIDFHG